MSVDKSIDYVDQDGYKNYTKNSDSVTVPRKFKARKNAPGTKLAYITDAEAKQLKKQNPGTPHKGPSNIPSYDSFDAEGSYTSGTAMSAAETGSSNARDRREVQASNIGAPSGAGPGVKTQAEQDLRAAAIAAGAGQRVNPGFFDSRDTVSPAELAAARAISPNAFRATRGGGLGSFFTGGGFLGNIIRAIGNRFGLGKKYNEPTYDMSQFNNLGLLTGRVNPDYYNDLGNEGLLSLVDEENNFNRMFDTNTIANLIDKNRGRRLEGLNTFRDPPSKEITDYQNFLTKSPDFVSFDEYQQNIAQAPRGIMQSSSLNDLTPDQLQQRVDIANQFDLPVNYSASDLDARARRAMTQPGFMSTLEPTGIGTVTAYDPYKEMYSNLPSDNLRTEVSQDDINKSKTRTFKSMDYDTYKMINPDTQVTPYEFDQLQKGNITEPGTYTI